MFRREVYFSCKFDDLFQSVKAKLPVASVTQKSMEPAILSFILAKDHPFSAICTPPRHIAQNNYPRKRPQTVWGGSGRIMYFNVDDDDGDDDDGADADADDNVVVVVVAVLVVVDDDDDVADDDVEDNDCRGWDDVEDDDVEEDEDEDDDVEEDELRMMMRKMKWRRTGCKMMMFRRGKIMMLRMMMS